VPEVDAEAERLHKRQEALARKHAKEQMGEEPTEVGNQKPG
jgi:hypothetical protein